MNAPNLSIFDAAIDVLLTSEAEAKAACAAKVMADWHGGAYTLKAPQMSVPDMPARPLAPELVGPDKMPKRKLGGEKGRVALLHAIAHIELNAIDLAFDMIARFGPQIRSNDQLEFVNDWIKVGDDESRHFLILNNRIKDYSHVYGDLPAHNGLWEVAERTRDDVKARLAIAPLVLEARGLDVTPPMIEKLNAIGDVKSASILAQIYEEEVPHVATGARWFRHLCAQDGLEAESTFHQYVRDRFPGGLKKPFNHDARKRAGLEQSFYDRLAF